MIKTTPPRLNQIKGTRNTIYKESISKSTAAIIDSEPKDR
jgi:hypothetical protein